MEYKEMTKITNINQLNEKLKKNYEKKVRTYLKNLKAKGYIILVDDTENRNIWQYNWKAKEFIPSKYTQSSIIDKTIKEVDNPFAITMEYDEYYIIFEKTIPIVTIDELNSFYEYNKALKNIMTEKELKKELNELEAVIKDRSRKINVTNDDVFEQMQCLINHGIVACDVSTGSFYRKIKYFKYSKAEQLFKPVSTMEIKELLEKTFNIKINERIIEKRMRKDWYTYGISSKLPIQWNTNLEYQKTIYEQENNKLNTIINSFN